MTWFLFVIFLQADRYYVAVHSMHQSEESCSVVRETVVDETGRPPLNYEAVCIPADFQVGL